jgi:hypothetical protein
VTVWVTVLVLVLVLMLVLTLGSAVVVVVVVVVGSVVVVVVVCSVVVGAAVVVAVVVVGAVADVVVRVIGVSVVGGVSGDVPPVRSLTRPKMINAISTGRERRMQRARRVCDTRGAVLLAAGPVADQAAARAADRSRRSWRTRSARREGSAVVRRSVARHGHR